MLAPKILITGKSLTDEATNRLSSINAEITCLEGQIDESRLLNILSQQSFDAFIVRANPPINENVIKAAKPSLRLIAKHGVGYDSIDVAAATKAGIMVTNTNGANASAVAEMTMALLLNLRRDVTRLDARVRAGQWDKDSYTGTQLYGQTIGIIGLGHIGKMVAKMAEAFGMKVIAHARNGVERIDGNGIRRVGLKQLLSEADVISFHCPLTDETKHLLSKETLPLLKRSAFIINTARGQLIEESALVDALNNGTIAGAGLDVYYEEPFPLSSALREAPNVIFSPHIAANTTIAMSNMSLSAAESVVKFFTNQLPDAENIVNRL